MPEFDPAPIYSEFALIPNENPLSDSGRWGPYYGGRPPLMVDGAGTGIHGTVEFAVNGSMYRQQTFRGADVQAYGCRPESGLGAALESNRIVALADPLAYTGFSSGWGGGIGESYFFRKYTNFAFIGIGGPPGLAWEPGGAPPFPARLGIRILPDRVEQWAGPEEGMGDMFLVQTHFETIPQIPWYFALETEEQGGINEVAWTCFFAGVKDEPEFLTWLPSQPPE